MSREFIEENDYLCVEFSTHKVKTLSMTSAERLVKALRYCGDAFLVEQVLRDLYPETSDRFVGNDNYGWTETTFYTPHGNIVFNPRSGPDGSGPYKLRAFS